MADGSVDDFFFMVALTAEAKKCLHSMIIQGKEVENWGEARVAGMVAGMVAGVPKGNLG